MSWNRPQTNIDNIKPRGGQHNVHLIFLFIALGIVLAVASVAFLRIFLGSRQGEIPDQSVKPSKLIKSVEPSVSTVRSLEIASTSPEDIRTLPDGRLMKYHPDGSPAWAYPRMPYSKNVVTSNVGLVKSPEEKIFKHSSDVEIAWLLNMEPGDELVYDWDYSDFANRFSESLKDPIRINPEDTDEEVLLKNAVLEIRNDLAKRHAAGEDINEIMRNTRTELQELGLYRNELKEQVVKIAEDDDAEKLTEKDYKDLIDAANLMLEERGAKPIKVPAFIKYKFKKELIDENQDND